MHRNTVVAYASNQTLMVQTSCCSLVCCLKPRCLSRRGFFCLHRTFTANQPQTNRNRMANKWRVCSSCGRHAGAWVEDEDGTRWTVTAPYGRKVKKGARWTCTLCIREGKDKTNAFK